MPAEQNRQPAAGHVDRAVALLTRPGLVIIAGGPGSGRSTALRQLAEQAPGPVHTGGGLASLRTVPGLALTRAVRARLPTHDVHLLAEAVRTRVRGGLLLLDDLHLADPATLAALPAIAAGCRVAATLRTPHRLPATAQAGLRAAAVAWLTLAPLPATAAAALARRVAPQLDDAAVADVVARSGGIPIVVEAVARHAGTGRRTAEADPQVDRVAYAIATALADLTRPARTALAALGLLGRPAAPDMLGPGTADLLDAGLISTVDDMITPVCGYVAEVAAGLLGQAPRQALHRRLADLVPAAEAAQHLAAAGDAPAAYRAAVAAADTAPADTRTDLLLFACGLPGAAPDTRIRLAAARAALAAGRPRAAARVLSTAVPLGVEADVLRGEALLQAGDPVAARAAVQPVPDGADLAVVAARDTVLLLAELAIDPQVATETAAKIAARHGERPTHLGVRAALAAAGAARRAPGWADELARAAAAAGTGGDPHTARWSAWLLVEYLAADGRTAEAALTAQRAAAACAAELAYSWQTRFVAAGLWCTALHGGAVPTEPGGQQTVGPAPADEVLRRAAELADHALPDTARGYAAAAAALVEADAGQLAAAQARLTAAVACPATDWVAREAAWLDGRPGRAAAPAPERAPALLAGLHRITARWAVHDGAANGLAPAAAPDAPLPVRRTLTAWATGTGFAAAADTWSEVALRERVRCLLAAGLYETDAARAVPHLLAAEQLATTVGLVVLAGRARRALRRHAVHRDSRGPRSGAGLTGREQDVLRLVAHGEPTRRIAGQLGISAQTVETHIRAGMRKLGARTRTEAAALAFEESR